MEEDFIHVVEDLHNKLENDDLELMWFRRNSLIYGRNFCHCTQIVSKASETLRAFKSANARLNGQMKVVICRTTSGKVSTCGFVKVNWDAAVDKVKKKMGISVVVPNHVGGGGELVATLIAHKHNTTEPVIAEATTTLHVVVFTRELGLQKLGLEGDYL
jgi:dihydrofolate reductase